MAFEKEVTEKNPFQWVKLEFNNGQYIVGYKKGFDRVGFMDDEDDAFMEAVAVVVNRAAEKLGIKVDDGSAVTKAKVKALAADAKDKNSGGE